MPGVGPLDLFGRVSGSKKRHYLNTFLWSLRSKTATGTAAAGRQRAANLLKKITRPLIDWNPDNGRGTVQTTLEWLIHMFGNYQVLKGLDPEYIEKLRSRFWAKVAQRGADDCWEWQGLKNHRGYGTIGIRYPGKAWSIHRRASRVAYELTKGPVLEGLNCLHRCDNPSCVNPDHLFLGTIKDNTQDMIEKGRSKLMIYRRGQENPAVKITPEQVREIRAKYEPGKYGCKRLAQEYPITYQQVWLIVTGKCWAHI